MGGESTAYSYLIGSLRNALWEISARAPLQDTSVSLVSCSWETINSFEDFLEYLWFKSY